MMGTISVNVTSGPVTGGKNFTISDAHMQNLLDWAKVAYNPYIQATYNPTNDPSFIPSNGQIMDGWVMSWINGSKDAVQRFETPAAVVPPPIVIT